MRDAAIAIGITWGVWALANIGFMFALEARAERFGAGAYVTGIFNPKIVIGREIVDVVTIAEYLGIWLHEEGHIMLGHLRSNLVLAILLPFYRSSARVVQQELEADAYAVEHGYGPELASALRKLSTHPFDMKRAEILERWESAAGRNP